MASSPLPLPPSALPLRVAVIGGGISGLAAAHRLTELVPHVQLSVFEASTRLGGVLDTVQCEGFLVERSADNFLTEPAAAAEICRRVGLADKLLPTDDTRRRAYVVRGGRLLPIPSGFYLMSPRRLAPLLSSPLLSWLGKLRFLAEPFVPRGSEQDESVAAFARRRLGREAYERLVQPLVAGIYTADPEQLSMAATLPQFVEYERAHRSLLRATLFKNRLSVLTHRLRPGHFSDQGTDGAATQSTTESDHTVDASGARYSLFAAPKYGMTSMVTALASRLPAGTVQLNTSVTSISRQPENCWQIVADVDPTTAPVGTKLTSTNPQSFNAVIIATPAHATAKLLSAFDPTLASELAAIPYAGCAVVSFGLHRRQIGHELRGFGFVVPQMEQRRIIAASFASLKFPGRAPDDSVLIRVFLGGALQPELLELSDRNLSQLAFADLAELVNISGEPQLTDIARWPASMPQYHVGHLERVARIEALAARWPGLALAGNAYRGVGIPQCIRSGEAAAEHVANHFLRR